MGTKSAGRIDELESIRGVAAVLVVLFHMPQWYPPLHAFPLIRHGGFMVDLFFVLSGYVICRAYGAAITSPRDALRFQLLRLGRLYPVHLLFLLPFLLIECARVVAAHAGGADLSVIAPFGSNSLEAFGLQLLLIQSFAPAQYWGTFNGPAWSISVEFYGYLLFALVVLICGARRTMAFGALFVLGGIALGGALIGNSNITRFLCGFFAGCLIAEFQGIMPRWGARSQLLALVILIAMLWSKPDHPLSVVGVILASGGLIAAIANGANSRFKRILRHRLLVKLGALSYTVYMAHFLVIYLAVQLTNRFLDAPRAVVDGNIIPQLAPIGGLAMVAVVVTATICISLLAHAYVEYPLRMASRKWVARRLGTFDPAR
jgi:peptidoglycan/LPS O-acetylase OafA/YrhL